MANQPSTSRSWWPWLLVLCVTGIALAAFLFRHRPSSTGTASREPQKAAVRGTSSSRLSVTARPRATLSGHVYDKDGKPIAKASVCVWAAVARDVVSAETNVPRCSTTEKDGAYILVDLLSGTPLIVSASAVGFAPRSYRTPEGLGGLWLTSGERRTGLDFQLRPGVEVHGCVQDLTGGTISGALVVSESSSSMDRAVTTSDAKGAFSLWVEPEVVSVSATASGYSQGSDQGLAPLHFFKIQLTPGATLIGRTVLAGTDTAVAGVRAEAIPVEGDGASGSARTDDEGRFRIEGLAPGRYRVEALVDGREGYSPNSVALALGETSSEVLIELEPAFVVEGRVIEQSTKEPCSSGEVVITDPRQNEYSRGAIEPNGSVRMASVIPGTYDVQVRCRGHFERKDYPPITVVDRDLPPFTWEVEKGASIRVDVVDSAGKALTEATVSASATTHRGQGAYAEQAVAEVDGTYLLVGLAPGEFQISASTPDGASGRSMVTLEKGQEPRVRISLPSYGIVEGIVEDPAHRPVRGASLALRGPSVTVTGTGADGTFTLNMLEAGSYELALISSSGEDQQTTRVVVTAPGRTKVKLTVPSRPGVIEGRVVDTTGRAVTDAFIEYAMGTVSAGSSEGPPTLTDTDGRFTLEGLAEGDYEIRASRKGGGEAKAQAKTGTRSLVIKLRDGGSIAGTLTARGVPVDRFTISATNSEMSFSRDEMFFRSGGNFFLNDLPEGKYHVQAQTPMGVAETDVTLAPGEQKQGISLALKLSRTVVGRVVDLESGAPVAGLHISLGNATRTMRPEDGDQTGADGVFRMEGVQTDGEVISVGTSDDRRTYLPAWISVPVRGGEGTIDAGRLRIPRDRIGSDGSQGYLGLYVDDALRARSAYGPAEQAGVQEGDVVVSVDGFDVQGDNRYLFPLLTRVPSGRVVRIGLASGRVAALIATGY